MEDVRLSWSISRIGEVGAGVSMSMEKSAGNGRICYDSTHRSRTECENAILPGDFVEDCGFAIIW